MLLDKSLHLKNYEENAIEQLYNHLDMIIKGETAQH